MHWIVVLGVVAGMRTMTPIAVVCWFAWAGMLPEAGWAHWSGTLAAAMIFTLAALGEYVVDLLPQTPSRTQTPLVMARLAAGALAGALAWWGVGEPVAGGVLMGSIGALIGTYGGYRVRMKLARLFGRDWPAGVLESVAALALACLAAHSLHDGLIRPPDALLHGMRVGIFG